MKTLSSYLVPKLAQKLTGCGKSPQLIDNLTPRVPQVTSLRLWLRAFFSSLGLLKPLSGLRPRITHRRQVKLLASGWFLILSCGSLSAHAAIISTVAGNGTAGFSGDGGAAISAQLNNPYSVAVDSSGNLYIADKDNHCIRKVTAGGIISTVAGTGTAGYNGDGGVATSAQLNYPQSIAVDSSGNLYIADSSNNRIRQVTPGAGGIISTVAGTGTTGFSGDNGAATSAQLNLPYSVAVDSRGNLYIADSTNNRIRQVTGGIISTVAGARITWGSSGDGGAATSAQFSDPVGVTVDSSGNLYIADLNNHRIRKVNSGIISTVAGIGTGGYNGDGVAATSAQLNLPYSVAVDSSGNLYIADSGNNRIRQVTPGAGGIISTVAGTGTTGFSGDNGAATSAQLYQPLGVAVDSSSNLYIVDNVNNRIRKITLGATMAVQGNSTSIASGDTTPATTDNTDFGSTPVGTPVSKTFTMVNTGELPLNLTGAPIVSVTGSGFSVTTPPTSPVAAVTGTTNVVIQFAPTAAGVSNGMVSIANNDSLNNPYTFNITGTGIASNQTISFTPPASGTAGGSVTLTATATSGLAVTLASTTTGICTVSGSTVNYVTVGTCTITANQAGNTNYNTAPLVSGNITVRKANQTLTFTPPASATVGDPPVTLTATATSGLLVTFASTTTGICTVSGTTVNYVSAGTCTVTADQAGDANYNAAPPVSGNITVGKANQTISFTPPASGTVGGTATLNATATSGLTVTLASTTTGICTVSGTTVSYVNAGTCTLTANQAGNTNYNVAPPVSGNLTVSQATPTPAVPPAVSTMPPDSSDLDSSTKVTTPTTSNVSTTSPTTPTPSPVVIPTPVVIPAPVVVTPPPVVTLLPVTIVGANFSCLTRGAIDEVCNYGGQEVTDLNVQESGIVSNGVVKTTVVNTGWVSNFHITATGKLSGGVVTGYIKNEGVMRDFEFVGMSILGGTLGGVIQNNSRVGGFFQDVTLLPNTKITGGRLRGIITGDKNAPALLENVRVMGRSKLSGVKLGKNVKLEKGVKVED